MLSEDGKDSLKKLFARILISLILILNCGQPSFIFVILRKYTMNIYVYAEFLKI